MPKIAKHSRTPLQEKILMAMALLHCIEGEGGFFRSRAIAQIVGGRWTKYRVEVLDQMVFDGWLVRKTVHHWFDEDFYALSDQGKIVLEDTYRVKPMDVWRG